MFYILLLAVVEELSSPTFMLFFFLRSVLRIASCCVGPNFLFLHDC